MNRSQENLSVTFRSIAEKMRIDFEAQRQQVEHRGLRGRAREVTLVGEYLERYLPRNLLVRRNVEIVSADGQVSTECDVVICDPATPPLWTAGDVEVVPIECVHAVIEVKSRLDATELRSCCDKIGSIKRFPKTAFMPQQRSGIRRSVELYGRDWEFFPVLGFVFAFESADLQRLGEVISEHAVDGDLSPEHRIDGVYVLSRGAVVWGGPEDDWRTAQPGPIRVRALASLPGRSPLPLLAMHLQGMLQSTFMPKFRIGDYMGDEIFGSVSYFDPNPDDPETSEVDR